MKVPRLGFGRLGADDRSSAILVAALLAPLAFVVAMYLHAQKTERGRQAVVAGAMRDYAAVAAWRLSTLLSQTLHDQMSARTPMAKMGRPHTHVMFGPGVFTYEPSTGAFDASASPEAARHRADVIRIIGEERQSPVEEPHRSRIMRIDGQARLAMLNVPREGGPVSGYLMTREAFAECITWMLKKSDLLPRTLVRAPYGPDKISVRIGDDGSALYTSHATTPAWFFAHDTAKWGQLPIAVALSPALAPELLLDVPPAKSPFAAILVLSLVLAAAGLVQLRRARELSRMKTQFVANVSHELRTPLAHISMFAETLMLGRERSGDERRDFARIVYREAGRLTALIDRVLAYSRGTADQPLERAPFDIGPEIGEVLRTFGPIAEERRTRVDTRLAGAAMVGDRNAFHQILLNLLENAVKYGPEGQIIVLTVANDVTEVVITVDDQGPGIAIADRDRVFEPFVRLANSRGSRGTGIGLSVVRDLVVRQAGRIAVADAPGGGARFEVRFPAHVAAPPSLPRANEQAKALT